MTRTPSAPGMSSPTVSLHTGPLAVGRGCRRFLAGLRKKVPGQPFLIGRYGDHQPEFSPHILDPGLDEAGVGKKLEDYDPRYYATYYAIDAINFEPVESPAVMEAAQAPFLPLGFT